MRSVRAAVPLLDGRAGEGRAGGLSAASRLPDLREAAPRGGGGEARRQAPPPKAVRALGAIAGAFKVARPTSRNQRLARAAGGCVWAKAFLRSLLRGISAWI